MPTAVRDMGLMVKRLQVRHHRAADAALADLGVSLVQWDALRHMHENSEASLHDLAQLTFQTDQAFGTLAGRLLARGLVERVPGPGRVVRHRLTAEGERVRRAGTQRMQVILAESFSPLSDAEQQTLASYLSRLLGPDAVGRRAAR